MISHSKHLNFFFLLCVALYVAACTQAADTPKEKKLNQMVIVGESCIDHKKSVPEGIRGLIRVDVIKNLRAGTAQVTGQGFVSKTPITKINPYELFSQDPRGQMAQRRLSLVNLGLTLELYFKDQPSSDELGVPSVVSREQFQQELDSADPAEVARIRQKIITLKGRSEDVPGFFRAQSLPLIALPVGKKTETIDGLRGMGPFVSFVLATKADALAGVELLIPSDPQPDAVDYEDPTKMPKGKIGNFLAVEFEADPNRPAEVYGSHFKDSSLVVEFQGKNRAGNWIRRCVAEDTGEATTLKIPLDAKSFEGIAGPINIVLARKYRTFAPAQSEGGGDIYFEVNSVVVTGGLLAPPDAP